MDVERRRSEGCGVFRPSRKDGGKTSENAAGVTLVHREYCGRGALGQQPTEGNFLEVRNFAPFLC